MAAASRTDSVEATAAARNHSERFGFGFRFVWRLRDLPIAVRLRLVFACLLLLMMTGGAVALWQFHAIRDRVHEVSLAERRATAVMRVNNSIVMLMSRLHRAAENGQPEHFEAEARRLLQNFQRDTTDTAAALREITPETGRQKLVMDSLESMLDSLPARVDSLIDFARTGDRIALHARLTDQVDHTDEVGEQLMQETAADLFEARNRLFRDIEAAERRAVQALLITSFLSLVAAGVLAVLVTRSITRPLSALDRGALAVARGDFSHQVPVTGTCELAHLASAFNRMTREVADLYARERDARETAERLNQTLRRANDDLSVFAYSASHDLQEPLRTMTIYSQMLQRDYGEQLPPDAREFIEYLVEGAGRMSELIKDLLAYMEVSSGEAGAAPQVPAAAAVEASLSNLRAAVAESAANITYTGLPSVAVKPVHLQQLFQNLIGNAIKYRTEEPPAIRISACELDGYWQFSVKDNGIGIEPQYGEQIFRAFHRLHGRSQYPGTGIGLAICHKIVERYGGQIWLEPRLEKGSDFRFTLPK